jgi:hypothetical protein
MRYNAREFLEGLFGPPDLPPLSGPSQVDLSAEWFVRWDERAAVLEYDGGLSRELAEHLALMEIAGRMTAGRDDRE